MQVFLGNLVHALGPDQLELLIDYALGVSTDGKIEFVKPRQDYKSEAGHTPIPLEPTQFLFPGFIDTHAHAPQFPNNGIFGDSTLLDWLATYTFPLESQYKGADSALAREVYAKVVERQLQNGTTMTSYFGTTDSPSTLILAEICLERGQKAQIGRVCMERFCPEALVDASIESDMAFIDGMSRLDPSKTKVWPVVTPRFAPSCEFSTLERLGQLACDRNLPVQTHINENKREIEWVRELFPSAENYTDVYFRAGLLKHDTVLAHGIHFASQKELDLVKQQQAGISHCPNSNASIASGIAPIKEFLRQGIKVSLGSDISGGSTVSILKNARLALLMSRLLSERQGDDLAANISVANALFLATLGGAQVLDRAESTGNFLLGKTFDAQLVDIKARDSPIDIFDAALPANPEERLFNFVNKWVNVGDDRNTLKVWVDGKLVHAR